MTSRAIATRLRHLLVTGAALGAMLAPDPAHVKAQEAAAQQTRPTLVTFGRGAKRAEGDHDYRQVIRILVPADAGRFQVRVFDPDIGGAHDELNAGFGTSTRFSLFGDGATATLLRDSARIPQERVEGEALASAEFRESGPGDNI
jgi:hypothetical protein